LWVNLTKIGKLLRLDFGGGVGKKSLPPIFSPLGCPGAPKFLRLRGLVGVYLLTAKSGVRGWLLPVSKNFHYVTHYTGCIGGFMHIGQSFLKINIAEKFNT